MNKLILHVTDLDSLIWYNKLDNMSVEDMRSRILRTEAPNDKMAMGTAWHSILENPPDSIDTVEHSGFKFKVDCEAEINLPQIREIRANKTYNVDGLDIVLTGGCDGITGNTVKDHKLTFRENIDTYFDSYQWRAYLDIFNADTFEYYIYSAKDKKGIITIDNISSVKMYRYPDMVSDLESGIRNLVDFIKDFIPEKLN